jgi:transposase-like protein
MKCPNCNSIETVKNGRRKERQSYKCKHCSRQFLASYRPWRYSDDVKQLCIKMYLNGMGLRGTLARHRHSSHQRHALGT